MKRQSVVSTPLGSSIEALGDGLYRVCDAKNHCAEVSGLWSAGELVREVEVFHRWPNARSR